MAVTTTIAITMQAPPRGPGYGPPSPHGPYGGPAVPYGPYGHPPPPKRGPNVAVIVLVVVVAFVVIGGGGCLVCGMLAIGATAHGADAASPDPTAPAVAGERTIERTAIAVKLESALRNDGVPFDHVECPVAPPSSGTFSCAVIPANEGDPAEVTVTNGPREMAYALQEGFVILDGAKLASTFTGVARRAGSPAMTTPCFRGKILKHADTTFTCEVRSGGAVVGHVTTRVVGRSGDVKMDYEPLAKGSPPAGGSGGSGGVTGSLDGTYACLMSTYQGGVVQVVPSLLPRFTIAGRSYTSGGKTGTIRTSGPVVLFLDGAYDGWQGALGSNSTGRYILLRGQNHADAQPGVSTKIGDSQCYVQK